MLDLALYLFFRNNQKLAKSTLLGGILWLNMV
jgi:hypothetical protein